MNKQKSAAYREEGAPRASAPTARKRSFGFIKISRMTHDKTASVASVPEGLRKRPFQEKDEAISKKLKLQCGKSHVMLNTRPRLSVHRKPLKQKSFRKAQCCTPIRGLLTQKQNGSSKKVLHGWRGSSQQDVENRPQNELKSKIESKKPKTSYKKEKARERCEIAARSRLSERSLGQDPRGASDWTWATHR